MKLRQLRLLADENINTQVIAHLRKLGLDVLDASAAALLGCGDDKLLTFATQAQRVIITHDADFGTLAVRQQLPLLGIIYLRPGHIDPSFTISTIDAMIQADPNLEPPFIMVVRRTGTQIILRVRYLTQL